ncbi:MAG: ABC transporter ATP-binding protein [Rhodobacteraceae bacterium]|nr:ABC transporter ATP-binding protein [Paracoccaceae bacterium]
MTAILETVDLGISFGGLKAVDDVSLAVRAGEILSVIGPNGAGKTTLFNLISGVYTPKSGRVMLQGQDVTGFSSDRLAAKGLTRTFQNLQVFQNMTALENVMVGCHLSEGRNVFSHLLALPSVRRHREESRAKALACLDRVGMVDIADRSAASLSYGALKRLEIARALALDPSVLLLDEPAAGCNPSETEEIDEIISQVASDGIGVVLVEHDMRLVMKISNHILVLNFGKKLAEGDATEIAADPHVIEAYLGIDESEGESGAVSD